MRKCLLVSIIITLSFVLVIGCSKTNKKALEDDALQGSWSTIIDDGGFVHNYSFSNGVFVSSGDSGAFARGTYTVSGDELTIVTTEFYEQDYEDYDTYRWYTKEEFSTHFAERIAFFQERWNDEDEMISEDDVLEDYFPTMTFKYSIEGDKLYLSYPTQLDLDMLGMTYEELVENTKNFQNQTLTPEWSTNIYTKEKE